MKWMIITCLLIILLPFLVKLGYMLFALYRHYFFVAINSKYPIDVKLLSLVVGKGEQEQGQRRKPIGFDTSFTEEDKTKVEAIRSTKKR